MAPKMFNIDKTKLRIMVIGMAISLVVPVIAWMVDLIAGGLMVGAHSLSKIHLLHPSLFFVDLVPIITAMAIYLYLSQKESIQAFFKDKIRQRDELIGKNADFAKRIGQGDYTSPFEPYGNEDTLGMSLLRMRDNLVLNTRKEAGQSWIAAGKDQI
ncbi:MAG TPA: hypothetical protein VIH57_16250, partial [Bacteroidales bacterium]